MHPAPDHLTATFTEIAAGGEADGLGHHEWLPSSQASNNYRSISIPTSTLNVKAEPFVWTKKKVRQRRFKGRRITQL